MLTIDLEAIRHNIRLFRAHLPANVKIMAVVKANGYGHGAVQVAQTALQAGATHLAVARCDEGLELRQANILAPILVMGHTPDAAIASAIDNNITLTVFDMASAMAIHKVASQKKTPCAIHLKIDTGMGRLGVLPNEVGGFITQLQSWASIIISGVFSHFSCADCDPDYTLNQIKRFESVVAQNLSLIATAKHMCNSAGAIAYPQAHYDMVRVGIAMYGLSPFAPSEPPTNKARDLVSALKPALEWHTYVSSVKTLPHGSGVSYGATYRCVGERRIAVIPLGYGDGFRRAPQNFGKVLVNGAFAPIVGRVCMDQSMIDVTHVPDVKVGDMVTIIGTQGQNTISTDDIARQIGTINYDIVTSILERPDRLYVDSQTIV
jgi:alanine racemase